MSAIVDETFIREVGVILKEVINNFGEGITGRTALNMTEDSFDIKIDFQNGRSRTFGFLLKNRGLYFKTDGDESTEIKLIDIEEKPSGEIVIYPEVLRPALHKAF